jgi:hypothetical protein
MRSAQSTRAESKTKDGMFPCASNVSGPDKTLATNDVVFLETVEEVLLSDNDESDGEKTTTDSDYDKDYDSDDEEGM